MITQVLNNAALNVKSTLTAFLKVAIRLLSGSLIKTVIILQKDKLEANKILSLFNSYTVADSRVVKT